MSPEDSIKMDKTDSRLNKEQLTENPEQIAAIERLTQYLQTQFFITVDLAEVDPEDLNLERNNLPDRVRDMMHIISFNRTEIIDWVTTGHNFESAKIREERENPDSLDKTAAIRNLLSKEDKLLLLRVLQDCIKATETLWGHLKHVYENTLDPDDEAEGEVHNPSTMRWHRVWQEIVLRGSHCAQLSKDLAAAFESKKDLLESPEESKEFLINYSRKYTKNRELKDPRFLGGMFLYLYGTEEFYEMLKNSKVSTEEAVKFFRSFLSAALYEGSTLVSIHVRETNKEINFDPLKDRLYKIDHLHEALYTLSFTLMKFIAIIELIKDENKD